MSSSGDSYLDRADGQDIDDGISKAILAPILALGSGLAMLVSSAFENFTDIFSVVGDVRELIGAFFTEPTIAIRLAAEATGLSSQQFGIAAIPVVFASIAIGLVIVDRIWGDSIPILDTIIPWR
ncbi:hypothetical protein [Halobellus rarus]|uniref:Uncharacterized protein n=1 Tax=Halobellus rarus TaxID=1126237 RepID=A0ABD6CQL0_9EURY|nr:hypothetical protein [Halobellus rarus]